MPESARNRRYRRAMPWLRLARVASSADESPSPLFADQADDERERRRGDPFRQRFVYVMCAQEPVEAVDLGLVGLLELVELAPSASRT